MSRILSYMVPQGPQQHITDSYVSTPPALLIVDERGAHWALGESFARMSDAPNGEFAFNVLRNGIETGEFASRIERRNGKIRIFTRQGWKVWSGRSFL